MEDVVLHYKPGPGQDFPALIKTTEKLLAPFPRRPLQVFTPWFPSIVDRHLPLRPARPPPRILSAADLTTDGTRETTGPKETDQDQDQDQDWTGPEGRPEQCCGSRNRGQIRTHERDREFSHGLNKHESSRTLALSPDRGVPFVPETPPDPAVQGPCPQVQEPGLKVPESGLKITERGLQISEPDPQILEPGLKVQEPCPQIQEPGPQVLELGLQGLELGLNVQEPGPQVHKQVLQVCSKAASPSKRCWTMFSHCAQTKDRTKAQSRVQASSRRFQQTMSKLRLQSRQRVKWIIDTNNCRDIEQVWRCLSRPQPRLSLPSCCNAHIDRALGQVWVYCDLQRSEQVGLSLKRGLELRGRISLWERRLGSFYSL